MGLWAKLNQPIGQKEKKDSDVEWKEEDGRRFLRVVAVWDGWKLALVFGISMIPAVLSLLLQIGWNPFGFEGERVFYMPILGPAVLAVLGTGFVAILIRPRSEWKFYENQFTRSSLWRFGTEHTIPLSRVRAAVWKTGIAKKHVILRTDDGILYHLPGKEEIRLWAEEHFEIHEDDQRLNPYRRE